MDVKYHSINTSQRYISMPDADVTLFPQWLQPQQADQVQARLQQTLAWQQDTIRLFGREVKIPRLQAWYGDAGIKYRYSGLDLVAKAWTPELLELKDQVEALTAARFNSVLVNWYRDGNDSMGWHSDDEPELGNKPVIASLSLGADRRFQMRHKSVPASQELTLGAGSLLVMRGETQRYWQHQVPKQRRVQQGRINLTFRYVQP